MTQNLSISLVLVISSLFVSCSTKEIKKNPEQIKHHENLGKFIESPITKPDNKNILFSLSQYYGTPQHQEFSKKPSPLNPKDHEKVYTLIYDGFEINVGERKKTKDKPYYLRRLVVHDNVMKLPLGIKIGKKTEILTSLFGEPKHIDEKNQRLSYCAHAMSCVSFHLNDDKIQRIIWDYKK